MVEDESGDNEDDEVACVKSGESGGDWIWWNEPRSLCNLFCPCRWWRNAFRICDLPARVHRCVPLRRSELKWRAWMLYWRPIRTSGWSICWGTRVGWLRLVAQQATTAWSDGTWCHYVSRSMARHLYLVRHSVILAYKQTGLRPMRQQLISFRVGESEYEVSG